MKQRLGFVLMIFIYSLLVFYIGLNGWIWLHSAFGLEGKWIYGSLISIWAFSYLIGSFKKVSLLKVLGSYWFAVVQYAILLLPLANLAVWLQITAGLPEQSVIIWTGAAVLAAFAGLFLYGTYNAYSPVVRSYTIEIPKQANHRSSLRIAMASDMHFGNLSGLSHLRRLVKEIKKINADIILFPGDIIDDDPQTFMQKKMGDVMKELSAPLGVYGVLGNHEYYGGAIPEFVKEMERVGVTILQDSMIEVDKSFYLVGRKDKTDRKREPLHELISKIDPDLPIIMMDHQPAEVKQAEQHGVDLLLSGHTHRGQMAPNHLITRKIFEVDWGYLQKNQLHAIVSSGFGFWGPPLRIGSRSEIVKIDLTFLAPKSNSQVN